MDITPRSMAAVWMVGLEDEPERCAEICIFEVFGDAVDGDGAAVGMGVHAFRDPAITEEFAAARLAIDPAEFHVYTADWRPGRVDFLIDGEHVRTVRQAPDYPMQMMVAVFDFPDHGRRRATRTTRRAGGRLHSRRTAHRQGGRAMAEKVLINLATGLEDRERVTMAFLVAGAALERGNEVAMFLTKEAVRLALPGHAEAVACEGCPPALPAVRAVRRGWGELLVCPICVKSASSTRAASSPTPGSPEPPRCGSGSATGRGRCSATDRILRHQDPQRHVQQRGEDHDADDRGDARDQQVDAEAAREAGRDAADQAAPARAGEAVARRTSRGRR